MKKVLSNLTLLMTILAISFVLTTGTNAFAKPGKKKLKPPKLTPGIEQSTQAQAAPQFILLAKKGARKKK